MNHKAYLSKLAGIFFLLISVTVPLCAGYTVIEDRLKEEVKTPSLKRVQKIKIKLDNGIEALVISDPETPKSGAALSVGVGMAHEPFHRVGLAHFVEHMLFMGNEKYPIEKEYHEFIRENGGTSNAYTSTGQTVYMFEINNNKMTEAFERFTSFFDKPLFNESGLSRERLAVDNEFTYRANNDSLREYLVFLELTKKDHYSNTWRCGTKETLADVPRDELVEWHSTHYGADKMKLVVYTAQPIEQAIEEIEKNLSCVVQSQAPSKPLESPMMDPNNLGKKVYIQPIKDLKSLGIIWEVPSEFVPDMDHHTLDLTALALAEEYPNSLASFLKEKGLVQSFSVGAQTFDGTIAIFQISAELTEKGLGRVDEIIDYCFQAINRFKQDGIPRYRYDELVNMAKTNFHYQSRPQVMGFVSSAADHLRYESLDTFPQKHSWPTQFSPDRNLAFLDTLKAENAVYMVTAPNDYHNKNLDQTEKLTGAKFCTENISQSQLQAWNKISTNKLIGMAPPNPYVPSQLNLVNGAQENEDLSNPEVLTQNDRSLVYFKSDSTYLVPEVHYSIYINSPQLNASAQSQVLTDLYTLALGDALSGLADQGSVAGLHYGISCDPSLGLNLAVHGYSEKSKLFLEEIVTKLKSHRASKGEFSRYQQKLKSYYENQCYKQQPYAQAMEVSRSILFKDHVSYQKKLDALNQLKHSDLINYCAFLFDQVYIRAQLYGNLDKVQALEVSDFLNDSFAQSEVYPLSEQNRRAILEFDPKSSPRYIQENSQMDGNAAVLLIGQGAMDFKKIGALKVLTKSIQTPFYDTLRTKQQTGYVVQSFSQEIEKQLFSFFIVFSNSHATRDLLARFELFNEDFLKTINTEEFDQSKYEAIKASVLEEYQQPKRNLSQKGSELTALAFTYDGDFEFKQKTIEALNALTFEEFQQFAHTYLGRQNPGRIAALVEGSIDPNKALDYTPIQNVSNFKAQLLYTSTNFLEKTQETKANEL